jgi:hypothetical protein
MTPDLARLRGFAEDYTAAWCSMDPAAVAAHYAPEGSLSINGGVPAVGRDALTAVAASFYEALPDMQVFLRELVVGFEAWTIGADGLIATSIGSYDAAEYVRQLAEGV